MFATHADIPSALKTRQKKEGAVQTAPILSVKITFLPNSFPRGSYLHPVDQNYVMWTSSVKKYSDSTTSTLETGIGKKRIGIGFGLSNHQSLLLTLLCLCNIEVIHISR